MRISRSRNHLPRMYSLCNHVLSEVDTAKYLGINLSSELSWSPHVSSVISKANSILGFLRHNLWKCPSKLKETAYLHVSLVRSTLEYAATIWDPYYVRDIDSLEQVQRRAARFTTGDYHTTSSVTAMLADLGWKRLEDRRKDLRLTLLYKIVHDHVAVSVDTLWLVRSINTRINIWPHIQTHINTFSVLHYSGVKLSPCQRRRGYICWVLQDSFGRPSPEGPAVIRHPNPSAIHSRGGLRITLPDQTRRVLCYQNAPVNHLPKRERHITDSHSLKTQRSGSIYV